MKLIVGLGNPDTKYQNTKHNLGQNIILQFVSKHNLTLLTSPKLSAKITQLKGQGSQDKIFVAITTEYMNNSGIAIKKIADYYKIPIKDIFVIHDELDLPVGEYKIQFDRGPAGHNGIKSTIDHLGTQAFNRIRVGIGKPVNDIPIENYVLLPFSSQEHDIIDTVIPKVITEIESIISK